MGEQLFPIQSAVKKLDYCQVKKSPLFKPFSLVFQNGFLSAASKFKRHLESQNGLGWKRP